jgi:hypothetical protein
MSSILRFDEWQDSNGVPVLDVSSGLSVPSSALPAGSILQVVSANRSTATSITSASFVSSNLTATITPRSTSSKVYILATVSSGNNANTAVYLTVYRGDVSTGTNLGPANGMSIYQPQAAAGNGNVNINYLDSPSTTNATTYTIAARVNSGTANLFVDSIQGTLTLMEVAG